MNSPAEAIEANINAGVGKANLPLGKMILLGIMAGAMIAIGGASSNVAVHTVADVGLARTLAGCIFPVGLMMIVMIVSTAAFVIMIMVMVFMLIMVMSAAAFIIVMMFVLVMVMSTAAFIIVIMMMVFSLFMYMSAFRANFFLCHQFFFK